MTFEKSKKKMMSEIKLEHCESKEVVEDTVYFGKKNREKGDSSSATIHTTTTSAPFNFHNHHHITSNSSSTFYESKECQLWLCRNTTL